MDLFSDAGEVTRRYGHYVDDLRRLLVFHGLGCGAAENFGMLRMKLADSNAFRTDVSALVRSIRDMEKGAISANEMLTVMALASAGDAFVEGRVSSGGSRSTIETLRIFLAGVGGWKETVEIEESGVPGPSQTEGRQWSGQPPNDPAAPKIPVSRSYVAGASEVLTHDADLSYVTTGRAAELQTERAPVLRPTQRDRIDAREAAPFPSDGTVPKAASSARTAVPPAPEGRSTDDQDAVTDAGQSFARKLAAGLALQSKEPDVPAATAAEEAGSTFRPETPEVDVTEAALAFPASAFASAPEQPKRLVLASPESAEVTAAASPAQLHKAPDAVTEGHAYKSSKEKAGRLLGIAAVLLAGVGLIGLAITLRSSPRSADRSAAETGATPRAPQMTGGTASSNEPSQQADRGAKTPESTNSSATPTPPLTGTTSPTPPDRQPAAGKNQHAADRSVAARAEQPTRETAPGKSRESTVPGPVAGKASTLKASVPRSAEVPASNQGTRAGGSGITPTTGAITGEGATKKKPQGAAFPPTSSTSAAASERTVETATGTRVVVPEAAMRRNLISSRAPVYPPEALKENVTGTVVLNAFIARDGTVKRMDVVRGPSVFIKSAMSAVSWRRYRPYLVGGKPVEVETPITVSYAPD